MTVERQRVVPVFSKGKRLETQLRVEWAGPPHMTSPKLAELSRSLASNFDPSS